MRFKELMTKRANLFNEVEGLNKQIREVFGAIGKKDGETQDILQQLNSVLVNEDQPYKISYELTPEGFDINVEEDCAVDLYLTHSQLDKMTQILGFKRYKLYYGSRGLNIEFGVNLK